MKHKKLAVLLSVPFLVGAISGGMSLARERGSRAGARAIEEDGAYLDPPYGKIQRASDLRGRSKLDKSPRSPVEQVIAAQTPVRSQASRGTCSIFSATALTEALLISKGASKNIDLSEEWLQYLVNYDDVSDGSTTYANLTAINLYGMASEQTLPYVGENWDSVNASTMAKDRCGKVPSNMTKSCLIVHRDPRLIEATDDQLEDRSSPLYDPDFLRARTEAANMKARYFKRTTGAQLLRTSDDVKQTLLKGTPLLLDMDFHYGAWNHRKAETMGISRNLTHWDTGVIGYPEPGSKDLVESRKNRAGHSVLVVGYDDDEVVTTEVDMADGTKKAFTYKGVFYIKNSWGTNSFGARTRIRGKVYPGYGVIPQKYAFEYGQFFRMMAQ